MKSGTRIGIMGGTFNPIHNGHLLLAAEAQRQVLLDKILFMPSGNSYMKSNVLETQKRVDMVALAIEQYPDFELSQIEQWRDPEQIFRMAVLVCAVRDDYDFDAIQKKGRILAESGAEIIYLNMPKLEISSTDIRAKVKCSRSISALVPPEVAHYIEQEHLYYEED